MSNWCILGDCGKDNCHHCYPVINCSMGHSFCIKNGCCHEIIEKDIDVKRNDIKMQENNKKIIVNDNNVLVTGCAGFIGSHVCEYLLKKGTFIYGIDNLNDYYDPEIKKKNLQLLKGFDNFIFKEDDIRYTNIIRDVKPKKIIHLASMAGVRYSIENPFIYNKVNVEGFIHILQESVKYGVKQIVYASSSSVYGLNKKIPFSENDKIESCNSPYACSKMAMELYAKTYSQLYKLSCIGLRFFTVYGPRGRPDMAPYKFLNAIIKQEPLNKYGDGTTSRDYTYIDDIVDGIVSALENNKKILSGIYNLGNSTPISLNKFIETCEKVSKKKAIINNLPMQLGDVPHTYADITKAYNDLNYKPKVKLEEGLQKTMESLL